jgi:N-acetylmuramoyl-L-alanine amidase
LSWISRFSVRTGKVLAGRHTIVCALLALLISSATAPAAADAPLLATYQGHTIRFTHVSSGNGGLAVGTEDPGLAALLQATGAVLTWKPGRRYVMVTTSVPVVVSFSVGDRRYDVGPISLEAAFAPYQVGSEVYLPFDAVLHALDLALRQEGRENVLQPQLASLDVSNQGDAVTIAAHGGAPLHPRIVRSGPSSITYAFDGVGTTLAGLRPVNAGGVRAISIAQAGTVSDPRTLVTVLLAPGAVRSAPRSNDDRDVVLAFSGPAGNAPAAAAPAPAAPAAQNVAAMAAPSPAAAVSPAANGPALVTGVSVQPSTDGELVSIAISGNATYQWHRLRAPDNRFWIDVTGAQLQGAPIEENEPAPVGSVRVRQNDPQTVRVALSLTGPKTLSVSPSATGLEIDVASADAATDVAREGGGSVGSVISSNEQTASVTPAPLGEPGGTVGESDTAYWKFGPHQPSYVPTNPRLIVIDPGHGGSDAGAIHDGVAEKSITLDVAERLRAVLVARGWQVKMTRDTDVDVYAPDDSARQELQARVDVANNAGARLFVSIHGNSYINSGPYGTTCYISKKSDLALARFISRDLANDGTKDDGIVKSHLYVTLHTRMPAVLVETAFLSNPGDFALLTNPAWRQKIAEDIADGIDQYTQAYPVPNAPAQ